MAYKLASRMSLSIIQTQDNTKFNILEITAQCAWIDIIVKRSLDRAANGQMGIVFISEIEESKQRFVWTFVNKNELINVAGSIRISLAEFLRIGNIYMNHIKMGSSPMVEA